MGRYLDIGGTRYLLEQLHDIMEKMLVGDVDLSDYVTKTELQKILDELNIDIDLSNYVTKEELEDALADIDTSNIDLSAYATKEYVTDAINNAELGGDGSTVDLSIYAKKTDLDAKADEEHTHTMSDIIDYVAPDLSAYAKKTDIPTIPSLDGYATEEYVDNALANIPPGGEGDNILVTLYNEWNKDRYGTSVPTVKLYAGTNTITFSDGVSLDVYTNSTDSNYYVIDDYAYKSKVNAFTINSETNKILHDYIFRKVTLPNGIVPERDYSVDGSWCNGNRYLGSYDETAYSFYYVPLPRGTYNITYNADQTPYLHPKTVFFVVDTDEPIVIAENKGYNYSSWFDKYTFPSWMNPEDYPLPYTKTYLCDYESTDTIANTTTFTVKSGETGIVVGFYEYRKNTSEINEGDSFLLSYSDFNNIIDIVPTDDNVLEIEFTLTNGTHSDVYAIDITNFDNTTQMLRYSTAQLLERVTEEEFAMYTLTEFATKKDLESIVVGGDTAVLDNYYTKSEVDALIPTVSDGKDGEDGFSPIATVTKTDGGATISITDTNGTTTVTVSDGVNGEDGKDGTNGTNGTDGITPHIDETTKHWFIGETDTGVLAEGVDGVDGKDGTDGYTPVRGTDYWTEQDIQTIKDYIDTELGVIENGSY